MLPLNGVEKRKIQELLASNIRTDGRSLNESRSVSIELDRNLEEFNENNIFGCISSAKISFGDTKVIAFVNCELTEPYDDRPNEGFFSLMTKFSPIACEFFEQSAKNSVALKISSLVELATRESGTVDLEALCIASGEKCWRIICTVHILNHNGNLADACSLAAISALSHFRRPEVQTKQNDNGTIAAEIVSLYEAEGVPISVVHWPICVTFGLYYLDKVQVKNDENMSLETVSKTVIITDPTEQEEKLITGYVYVVVNEHGEICALEKTGWPPLPEVSIQKCCEEAELIAKQRLSKLLA